MRKLPTVLLAAVFGIFAIFLFTRSRDPVGTAKSPKISPEVGEVFPLKAKKLGAEPAILAAAPPLRNQIETQSNKAESDQYVLFGFVPYQDDQTLAKWGFTTKEARDRANAVFGKAFAEMITKLVGNSRIVENEPGHKVLQTWLEDPDRDALRQSFYTQLESLMGHDRFAALLSSSDSKAIENQMLGFAEFPVRIDLRIRPNGSSTATIKVTLSTQLYQGAGVTEAYNVSQTMSLAVIERNLKSLEPTAKSLFQ